MTEPQLFKLKQFQNVPAKVLINISNNQTEENEQNSPDQHKRHEFLRKGEVIAKIQKAHGESKHQERTPKMKLKEPVPKANELAQLAPRTKKNFISTNFKDAIESKTPKRIENETDPLPKKHASYGQIPKYLLQRKLEDSKQEAIRKEAEKNGQVPPGMSLMKEEERLRTLNILKESLDTTKKELQKAPLVVETAGQKKRMKELEDRLKEQEDAIEIFSKDKVYIYDEESLD